MSGRQQGVKMKLSSPEAACETFGATAGRLSINTLRCAGRLCFTRAAAAALTRAPSGEFDDVVLLNMTRVEVSPSPPPPDDDVAREKQNPLACFLVFSLSLSVAAPRESGESRAHYPSSSDIFAVCALRISSLELLGNSSPAPTPTTIYTHTALLSTHVYFVSIQREQCRTNKFIYLQKVSDGMCI